MSRVVVFGCSGHAKVVIDALERTGEHEIVGLLGAGADGRSQWFGYPVLGDDADLPGLVARHPGLAAIIAIGDNRLRAAVRDRIEARCRGFPFVSAIHPSANVGRGATIGAGTFVAAGASLCADARIGEHVIVNTNASVDHDCVVEDFASIGPNAALGGNVHVGRVSHVGLGASVIQQIRIGSHVTVGAGAAVIRDLEDGCLAVGVPAIVK